MPYVHYTATQKAEAIALARVVGAEEAATRLSMEVRAIRRWSQAAGVSPDVDPDVLDAASGLAMAKVTAEIASGKLTGTRLAVVAGILQDKVRLRNRDKPQPETDVNTDGAAFAAWLAKVRPDLDEFDAIHALFGELHARERALSTPDDDQFEAWVEGTRAAYRESRAGNGKLNLPSRTWPDPSDVIDDWDQDAVLRDLDLEAWRAMDAERDADYAAMLARRKGLTDQMWRELYPPGASGMTVTDPEVEALLALADEYLRLTA